MDGKERLEVGHTHTHDRNLVLLMLLSVRDCEPS